MMSEPDCWALIREYHTKMVLAIDSGNDAELYEWIEKIKTVLEVMNGG